MPGARVASGDRVTLRTAEREDVPLFERQNNPELRLPTGGELHNRAALERWVEEGFGEVTPFVVCRDDDAGPGHPGEGEVERIGVVSVTDHGWKRPELAFWLLPEHHGDGYGAEAVSLLVDYAFQVHHHPAMGAETFADNEASRGLLESLGFTREGRIRDQGYWNGRYRDQVKYGLRREEWDGGE